MIFQENQTIIFTGDSITDANRRESPCQPLGQGYAMISAALLSAKFPQRNLKFFNRGIGGDTIRHLDSRWQSDVLSLKPDWLSVLVGINDVWRAVSGRKDEAVPLDEYYETYRRLLHRTQDLYGTKFILWEPFFIHPEKTHTVRLILKDYIDAVHQLADEFSAKLIPTQDVFDHLLTKKPMDYWTEDSVHPNLAGHGAMARLFLKIVEYERED